MKNMSLNALIAAVVLAAASTSAFAADDSPAAQRVQEALSSQQIIGQSQSASTHQQTFSETGMSVAAGRVGQSLNMQSINGDSTVSLTTTHSAVNDQGKSVAATRVQQGISDNA